MAPLGIAAWLLKVDGIAFGVLETGYLRAPVTFLEQMCYNQTSFSYGLQAAVNVAAGKNQRDARSTVVGDGEDQVRPTCLESRAPTRVGEVFIEPQDVSIERPHLLKVLDLDEHLVKSINGLGKHHSSSLSPLDFRRGDLP